MPVLIVIASVLVTFLAMMIGFYFLRSKVGLQDCFKNQLCSGKADVDQAGDSSTHSRKPWPVGEYEEELYRYVFNVF